MPIVTIRGVPVDFPFDPYPIQKDYMEKVIECLQTETNGVLESPTGTGKTLSLLCASLGWLQLKKAQVQASQRIMGEEGGGYVDLLQNELDQKVGKPGSGRQFLGLPTIIYASRTHSQLSQAMQELKRTSYRHMNANVLGSREQLCIHPDLKTESNNRMNMMHMCRLKVDSRSCHFYNRVNTMKDSPVISEKTVIDIEDIVSLGQDHKFCPYFMTKEIKQKADIVFAPYNYLLDPLARKALGIELSNNIIIIDEAHNIEKICEESASVEVKTTDVTLAMEEVTAVMKMISEPGLNFDDSPKDFGPEELCDLKEKLLEFEKQMDEIELKPDQNGLSTFDGNYIFEFLNKCGIDQSKSFHLIALMEKIIQYLAAVNEGPFARKGNGLQLLTDFLRIIFAQNNEQYKEKLSRCYKLHVSVEEEKKQNKSAWTSKTSAKGNRVLSYWCFSPGFGMNLVLSCGIRSMILTSGTLAPLKPLISELELDVKVKLENPHIIGNDQVCVRIVPTGPDGVELNSNFKNRDNPNYMSSLGRTILNLTRIIPDGLLIFFPSYPVMERCKEHWQQEGIWSNICSHKQILVEPRTKDAFNLVMSEYYSKIQDPSLKGAIFMGVCRGKVSEGLDFVDANGRAVIITGLPYPPLKDPKVILKRRYLDACNSRDKEFLRGEEWYGLEATRAVNQAIGRVIRHRHDYGAILLLDSRFNSPRIRSQLSRWLRDSVKVSSNFGEIIRDLSRFFRTAKGNLPSPVKKQTGPAEFVPVNTYKKSNFDFSTSSISSMSQMSDCSSPSDINESVTIHKRNMDDAFGNNSKRRKINLVPNKAIETSSDTSAKEYMCMVKKAMDKPLFQDFVRAMQAYKNNVNFEELKNLLDNIFSSRPSLRYLLPGLKPYIKTKHKSDFELYWENMR